MWHQMLNPQLTPQEIEEATALSILPATKQSMPALFEVERTCIEALFRRLVAIGQVVDNRKEKEIG